MEAKLKRRKRDLGARNHGRRWVKCPECRGSGIWADMARCWRCKGDGHIDVAEAITNILTKGKA